MVYILFDIAEIQTRDHDHKYVNQKNDALDRLAVIPLKINPIV